MEGIFPDLSIGSSSYEPSQCQQCDNAPCQEVCPTKVRIFGDLDDPNSEISQVLRDREHYSLKTHLGTKPKLYYLT